VRYEASAIVQHFQAAFELVDQEVLTGGETGLLECLSTDPRLPGAKIILGVQHGTAGTPSDAADQDAVISVIEKPFGPRRIAAVVNSFPIERSIPPDPGVRV